MTTEENQTPATELESDISVDSTSSAETPAAETPAADPKAELLSAISAGVDSAPARGAKKPADEAAGEAKGEEGSGASKDEKKDDTKDAADGAAKDGEDKGAEKKTADHVNDPVPAEWSERARERITSLVSAVKEKDVTIENQGKLVEAVMSTGATPEQFGGIITFLRDFNGQDPVGLERCQQALQTMLEGVALRMGKTVPGVDFLSKHEDLQTAVRYGQITAEHAQELAVAREARNRASAAYTKSAAETKAQSEAAAERNSAITEMNELGDSLQATDPDYQRKYDLIVGPMTEAFKDLPPRQWKATFVRAWNAVKLPPAAPAPAAAPGSVAMVRDPVTGQFAPAKKGQPMRPVSPSGTSGAKAAPKSLREAIDFSLAGDGN